MIISNIAAGVIDFFCLNKNNYIMCFWVFKCRRAEENTLEF